MTHIEYLGCQNYINRHKLGILLPHHRELERGCIVGRVQLQACVESSDSPWFWGPWGWAIAEAEPFHITIPCKGRLGLFEFDSNRVH